jgi:ribosomal protein L14E/L6E/L27E
MIRTNITTSRAAKKIIKQKADALDMSFSAYLELAGVLYTPELQKR